MNLSVPTNWQPDLLEKLNKTKIIEIYGKLDRDPIGGGRPSFMLPSIDKMRVREYIRGVHKYGLKFNYLLNATCLGNHEWSVQGQKRIRKFLDWLTETGVDSVTIAIPYLLQVVKKNYPHFNTKVSVCARVSDPFQARYWQELGADEIALSPWEVNRDFALLRKIRLAVTCSLQVYANTRCLRGCPFVQYHYASHSHSSRQGDRQANVNFCMHFCNYLLVKEPWRLIAASWIRPEDQWCYQEAGVNSVKLSERGMKTECIQRIVEAYTFGTYKGNLMDLIMSPLKRLRLSTAGKGSIDPADASFDPRKQDALFFLDNVRLDGFLDYFRKGKCNRSICMTCGYCRGIAEKALRITTVSKLAAKKYFSTILEALIKGKI